MPKPAGRPFAQRYEEALRLHLRRRPRGVQTSRTGRTLGREAAALGLDAAELARLHDRALSVIVGPPASHPAHPTREELSAPAVFFLEVLHPLKRACLLAPPPAGSRVGADRHLTHEFLLADEIERVRHSRELGDEIAQVLTGAHLHLSALAADGKIRFRSEQKAVARTQRLIDRSISALHRLACQLHPAILENLGLIPTLRALLADLFKDRAERIDFSSTSEPDQLDPLQRTVLYRVALEALTNVVRHARATVVTVSVHSTPRSVVLLIRDDGHSLPAPASFSVESSWRLGLKGMRERIEMIGGRFTFESTPGQGTSIQAEIPVSKSSPSLTR